jgi:hypothetical protein
MNEDSVGPGPHSNVNKDIGKECKNYFPLTRVDSMLGGRKRGKKKGGGVVFGFRRACV